MNHESRVCLPSELTFICNIQNSLLQYLKFSSKAKKRMSDLEKHVSEIYQVLIQNGHEKFLRACNLADKIRKKESLTAFFIVYCNEFSIKQDKKTSLYLMKSDLKNGFTWTTCLAHTLVALPDIQCLKVGFYLGSCTNIKILAFFKLSA